MKQPGPGPHSHGSLYSGIFPGTNATPLRRISSDHPPHPLRSLKYLERMGTETSYPSVCLAEGILSPYKLLPIE